MGATRTRWSRPGVAVLLLSLLTGADAAVTPPGPGRAAPGARVVAGGVAYADGVALDVVVADGDVADGDVADGDVADGDGSAGRHPGKPVVVMVPGCCGDRADLAKLAEATAEAGAVVLSADWSGLRPGARFPRAYGQVACAVRFARVRAARYGGDPARVVLLGWSDGAMAAAVVGAAGDRFAAAGGCAEPAGSGVPDAVVGVAGFYGWQLPVDVRYTNERAVDWLGGTPAQAPQAWREATPYGWLAAPGTACTVLLVGSGDPLVADARRYAEALRRTGHRVHLREVPPAGDPSLVSPRTAEGRATVEAAVEAADGAAVACPRPAT